MRNRLASLLIALVLSVGGPVTVSAAGEDAVTQTIRDQLQAFRSGDPQGAYDFASPNIKGIFPSVPNFALMVKEAYPMVWTPGPAKMLGRESRNGGVYQQVLLTDAQGALHLLEYRLIETGDGWKIDAVRVLNPIDGMV